MRRSMLDGHPNPTALFDLKHDPGGMVDIEFVVQYLVLAHAHDHPRPHRQRRQHRAAGASPASSGSSRPTLAARVADAYREFRRSSTRCG